MSRTASQEKKGGFHPTAHPIDANLSHHSFAPSPLVPWHLSSHGTSPHTGPNHTARGEVRVPTRSYSMVLVRRCVDDEVRHMDFSRKRPNAWRTAGRPTQKSEASTQGQVEDVLMVQSSSGFTALGSQTGWDSCGWNDLASAFGLGCSPLSAPIQAPAAWSLETLMPTLFDQARRLKERRRYQVSNNQDQRDWTSSCTNG